jgi:hypothetical protein
MTLSNLPLFDWRPPPLIIPATPFYTTNNDSKFDIQVNVANLREHKLGRLLSPLGRIELKSETWQWRSKGNFALEYAQWGRPSGFRVCEAEAWAHELNDDAGKILVNLMFPLERLKELARYVARRDPSCIRHGCGDNGATSIVVVPLYFFVDWLLQGGGAWPRPDLREVI